MKKNFGFYLRLTLAFIAISAVRLSAQDVVEFLDISTLTPETISHATVDPVYSALVVLFGYIGGFIPGVKKLNTYLRVLAFGLVLGLGFYLFGGASIWKVALSFLISTGLVYDGFLKPLGGVLGNILKKKTATIGQ